MRIAVLGATGNVGTGLLRALREDGRAGEVVGVARRVPPSGSAAPAPYDIAAWHSVDISAPGPDEPVVTRLTRAFAGADVVVLLAWAMQPSHDREVLRRTNVTGNRRAIAAAVAAGVPHLVVASSVGAYAPALDDVPRPESWATEGVRGSDYSADKVALERLMDEAQTQHPDLRIARVRPGLVFQRAAGSAIERYFLGPLLPAAVLRRPLPLLPWPRGVRFQGVHADDLAAALREIALGGHDGAFNIAAPDVLRGPDLAAVLDHGRVLEVPVRLARAAVHAGWLTRGVAISPGWIDLAAGVPLMSTDRARAELGWEPRWSAVEALADLVDGMARGSGTSSPVLRPRSRARRSLLGGQTELR